MKLIVRIQCRENVILESDMAELYDHSTGTTQLRDFRSAIFVPGIKPQKNNKSIYMNITAATVLGSCFLLSRDVEYLFFTDY